MDTFKYYFIYLFTTTIVVCVVFVLDVQCTFTKRCEKDTHTHKRAMIRRDVNKTLP